MNRLKHKCGGMAMLSVLFIIIAIVVVSMGYLHRADMASAAGHSMTLRIESDYLAWAGVEHARAQIQASEPVPLAGWSASGLQVDGASNLYYDVSIGEPNTAAAIHIYPFSAEGYALQGAEKKARSVLHGIILYDSTDGKTTFGRLSRQ